MLTGTTVAQPISSPTPAIEGQGPYPETAKSMFGRTGTRDACYIRRCSRNRSDLPAPCLIRTVASINSLRHGGFLRFTAGPAACSLASARANSSCSRPASCAGALTAGTHSASAAQADSSCRAASASARSAASEMSGSANATGPGTAGRSYRDARPFPLRPAESNPALEPRLFPPLAPLPSKALSDSEGDFRPVDRDSR